MTPPASTDCMHICAWSFGIRMNNTLLLFATWLLTMPERAGLALVGIPELPLSGRGGFFIFLLLRFLVNRNGENIDSHSVN